MRKVYIQIVTLITLAPSLGWSRMNWGEAPTSEAAKVLKICVGPEGGLYERAARVFASHLEGRLDVRSVYTKGPLGNLEGLKNGDCDLAFTRSNTIDFMNSEQTANQVSGTLQLRTLDDGKSDNGKDPSTTLLSAELFREYAQLVCRRDLDIHEVSELYGVEKQEAGKLLELRLVEQKLLEVQNESQYNLQVGNLTGGFLFWKKDYRTLLTQVNMELAAVRAKIQATEGTRPFEVIIINEGDEQLQISQTAFRNLGDVTWYQLTKAAPQYASIRTRLESGQQGLTPTQVGLLLLKSNPNSCFLSVDRLGTDHDETALQKANNNPQVAREVSLVDLDDGDFKGTTVQSLPIYESVNLQTRNILMNLRAKRPDGSNSWWARLPVLSYYFGKRVRDVQTLAIRTLLVANQTWFDNGKIYSDPVLQDAIMEGIRDVKLHFQDPALK